MLHPRHPRRTTKSTGRIAAFAFAGALLAPTVFAASAADAQEPSRTNVQTKLNELTRELDRLLAEYEVLPEIAGEGDFEERVTQGQIFLSLEDYERASLVLYGAVSPPSGTDKSALERRPGYADAVYSLAEALRELRNYQAAERYYAALLSLPGNPYAAEAISALMQMAASRGDHERADEFYARYLEVAGGRVPSDIRYARGRGLFLSGRDEAALEELAFIRKGTDQYLRARYIVGAVKVRQGKLEEALAIYDEVAFGIERVRADREVKELAHLARGRIYYELDKLTNAIDAYQYIPYDSDKLTAMLYEISWTYVRRGQLAYNNTDGDEAAKLKAAAGNFDQALEQLSDLQLLEPDSERTADIKILIGNLRLQRNDFDYALLDFEGVLDEYGPADEEMRELMANPAERDRLLRDILTLESGGKAFDTRLPAVVAKKAGQNKDVSDAIRVFKDIQASRAEIAATEKMLFKLERALATSSKNQLFRPLAPALSRSQNVATNLLRIEGDVAELQHAMANNLDASTKARLSELKRQREEIEEKLASIETDAAAIDAREQKIAERIGQLEQALHVNNLQLRSLELQLQALDKLFSDASAGDSTQPQVLANMRNKLRQVGDAIASSRALSQEIDDGIEQLQTKLRLSGGRGESEAAIRDAYAAALTREEQALEDALGPAGRELASLRKTIQAQARRNQTFRARVDKVVDRQVNQLRNIINSERENMKAYKSQVEVVNAQASAYRDRATAIALDAVREELNNVVVRADVGVVDVAFRRKQLQTERISKLRRQQAAELTDLNQAFADLQRDEAQQ